MHDSLSEQLNRIEAFAASTCSTVANIWQKVLTLEARIETMSAELDRLTEQVARNTTVSTSAVTLIKGLADQIRALKDDPVKLAELANTLTRDAGMLAAAVTENTPTPPVPPTP